MDIEKKLEQDREDEVVEYLEQDPSRYYQWFCGGSLLHLASGYGCCQIIELALANGIDINVRSMGGQSALHWSCYIAYWTECRKRFRAYQDVLEVLTRAGLSLEVRDTMGDTALSYAIDWLAGFGPPPNVIGALLQAGAHADTQNNRGQNPLHRLCECAMHDVKAYQLLVDAGARPDQRDNQGKTPLDVLREETSNGTHLDYIKPDEYLEMVELLAVD